MMVTTPISEISGNTDQIYAEFAEMEKRWRAIRRALDRDGEVFFDANTGALIDPQDLEPLTDTPNTLEENRLQFVARWLEPLFQKAFPELAATPHEWSFGDEPDAPTIVDATAASDRVE